MSVHVRIETASRAEAELIAGLLQQRSKAESWRGYGVIRLRLHSDSETAALIDTVRSAVEQHDLDWVRVRYDDNERVFRGNGRSASRAEEPQRSPSTKGQPRPRPRSLTDLVAELTSDWPSASCSRGHKS